MIRIYVNESVYLPAALNGVTITGRTQAGVCDNRVLRDILGICIRRV